MPLRILAARDVWCMDPRAEADWCSCMRRVDGLIYGRGGHVRMTECTAPAQSHAVRKWSA
eukprot:COSAG02_NODE_63742_length_262_cov_0.944785_1_plen_59_part_01